MNNLIQKIKTTILENRKNIIWLAFFIMLFWADNSFAAVESQTETKKLFEQLIAIGNIIFALGGVLIGILTQFIGLFLQPAWTTGSIIGLDVYLKSLWVLVSNLVYFIFAFILIIIAFMNIIGKGENTYQLKTALPHFIVGILIVPFSWFIVQFVISISSLLTVSALSLPWDMFGKGNESFNTIQVPTNCTVSIDKMMAGSTGSGSTSGTGAREAMGFKCSDDAKDKKSIGEIMGNGGSLFSIMYVYSYGIMKVQDLDKLYVGQITQTSNIGSLVANVIFNGIFILRFLILLIALAIAMFSRGVVLWLFTIFSPIFGLLYFFNGKAPEALKGLSKLSFKDFISLAMVPVYVGLALSFGLLFSFVATQGLSSNGGGIGDVKNGITGSGIHMGGMTLNIEGRALGSYKDTSGATGNAAKRVTSGRAGFVSQLFIDLIAIAVLWMAVMAAISSSKITESVVQPIAAFGKSIGGTAMKLPQYAPIFPGGQTMDGLRRTGSSAKTYFDTKSQNSGDDFMKRNNLFQSDGTKAANNAKSITTEIQNKGLSKDTYPKYVEALKEFKDTNSILANDDAKNLLKTVAEKSGVSKDKIKFNNTGDIADLVKEIHNNSNNLTLGNGINGKNTKIDTLTVDDLNDNLKGSRNNPSDDNSGATSKNNGGNTGNTTINVNLGTIAGKEGTGISINNGNSSITDINNFSEYIKSNKSEFGGDTISKKGLKESLQKAGLNGEDDEIKIDEVINKLGDNFFKKELN